MHHLNISFFHIFLNEYDRKILFIVYSILNTEYDNDEFQYKKRFIVWQHSAVWMLYFLLVLQSHIIRTFMNVKMSLMKEIMYTHTPKKVAELEKKSRFGNKFANSFNNVWIDLILAAYVLYIYFIYICNFFY